MTFKTLASLCISSVLLLGTQSLLAQVWSVDEMRNRMQIEETMNRYLYALDTVDPDAYASVFTEDGALIVRETSASDDYEEHGREEIKAYAVNLRKQWNMDADMEGGDQFGPLRHVYYNFIINEITDSTAFAETYWTTRARNPDGGPAIIASMGRSEDHFRKVNGQWLFEKRIIIVDMDTPLE